MIQDKIKTREVLAELCEDFRAQGKTVGFTSGAFDLLHAGHTDYLEKAGQLCDVLIVGVNTDASVKMYKGPDRPVVPEDQRIRTVAALESVSYAFLFDERRNQKNIEILKPDLYIKAGDYSSGTLTSKEVVEKYGGEVKLIPVEQPISTTDIIDKVTRMNENSGSQYVEQEKAVHLEQKPAKPGPAVFFDRDGTINEEVLYLHEPEQFKLLPHAIEGMKQFQDMGYRIIIITNQPGIGIGYYTKNDFFAVNRTLLSHLSKAGILVDKIYFCPHSKSVKCDCRKPGQALIERAREELNLDLSRSIMIGDRTGDMEAGRRAGMTTILVRTGFGGEDSEYPGDPDYRAKDLSDAARWVLEKERRGQK
ncbi:HAD-IIIA family hydrolase [bacterium]|nr:HAD-IIIA family hydrolase [bacterium]